MTAQLEGLNRRFKLTEERIKGLETVSSKKKTISIEIMQSEEQQEKKNEENEHSL